MKNTTEAIRFKIGMGVFIISMICSFYMAIHLNREIDRDLIKIRCERDAFRNRTTETFWDGTYNEHCN